MEQLIVWENLDVTKTTWLVHFFLNTSMIFKNKVWTFWEGHKIRKNLPLSVASNFKWKIFSNCVHFSEGPNCNNQNVLLFKLLTFLGVLLVSSVSARKLKCPSSARLGTFTARLGSSWIIPARAHHYFNHFFTSNLNWTRFYLHIFSSYSC